MDGATITSRAVVLTVGTFLGGRIHVGLESSEGGRIGDKPSNALAARLRELPFAVGRLKTGTPPRLDGRTLDYAAMRPQPGDEPRPVFSFLGRREDHPAQVHCHITATNARTHEIIRGATDRSPMFTGLIEGIGPRYCPSVEDKVVRFAAKASHQIFVEPEGLDTHVVYPNGISTSLPADVQLEFVRSIAGFERAEMTRPGYAIEYDYFCPRGLRDSLETQAARRALLRRPDQRHDRLRGGGGAGPARRHQRGAARVRARALVAAARRGLSRRDGGRPHHAAARWSLTACSPAAPSTGCCCARTTPTSASRRSRARWASSTTRAGHSSRRSATRSRPARVPAGADARLAEQVRRGLEAREKYAGYIGRQQAEVERQRRNEETRLPAEIDYAQVAGLSNEARQRLVESRPGTLGQASRLPGITAATISILLVHLKKRARAA